MKADLILAADIHLREDTPVCRTDDYLEAQKKKLLELRHLQEEHNCPIIVAGDLFHKWNPSLYFLSWSIQNLPDNLWMIPGQHDLKNHNPETFSRTASSVLQAIGTIKGLDRGRSSHIGDPRGFSAVLYAYWYGDKPSNPRRREKGVRRIAVCHMMTWKKQKPFPGCKEDNARKLLKKYDGFDLIVTGDNHLPFTDEYEGRLLVNPGSMMRMTADQADHKPRVYLYYAKTNTVKPFYFYIKKGVITREHIESKEERNERVSAFVESLKEKGTEIGLSFEENLKEHMSKSKTKKEVKKIVWEAVNTQ